MSLIKITSSDEFNDFLKSNDLSVVHFFAPWADQCAQMNEVLEQMIKLNDYKSIKFANIVAEDLPEVTVKYNVIAVPTILAFRSENVVSKIDGFDPTKLREQIQVHLLNKSQLISDTVKDKLKKIINCAPCMLFMKGSRETPRCGFSKAIINLLNENKVDYETFDILEDNEVREGLKKYSDWPTYPQLYINGELIGGLDIVKELINSGELINLLPNQSQKTENFEEKLKKLINQAPCMLFMKGNRETPRCGFSKAIVNLLDECKTDYETFDILEDNKVREGLKKYSNWPTYPQLYVNGELIGGLDIVKEMCESGDLDSILPKTKCNI